MGRGWRNPAPPGTRAPGPSVLGPPSRTMPATGAAQDSREKKKNRSGFSGLLAEGYGQTDL